MQQETALFVLLGMKGTCIYCGRLPSTRKGDHVPPQCLFGQARRHALVQVPCCRPCNETFARDDERMRNLLSCLENTESHALFEELRGKRNRSLVQQKSDGRVSTANLDHLVEHSSIKSRYSEGGIYIGKGLALKFDQPLVKRFLGRVTRALHHHTFNTGHVAGVVTSSNVIDQDMKFLFEGFGPHAHGTLGDDVFLYGEYLNSPETMSVWFMKFYGKTEFWTKFEIQAARP